MKKLLLISFIFFGILKAESAGIPTINSIIISNTVVEPVHPFFNLSTAKVKDIEKVLGRKLKFKEKVALKVIQWKVKKGVKHKKAEDGPDKGKTAMILGIIGIACLLLPYVAIASIPLAILAIIFGNQAKKENPNNGQAKAGVILGWVTLGLIVLAIALVVVILASWSGWGWG